MKKIYIFIFFILFGFLITNNQTNGYEVIGIVDEQKEFNGYIQQEINETLSGLYEKSILDKNHLKKIFNNIQLNYHNDEKYKSTMYEGTIRFLRDLETNIFDFQRIEFNFFPYSGYKIMYIKDKIKKIFIHEIGHYISFYIDKNSDQFYSICFEGKKYENNICSKNDFISTYSKTNNFEDYAETFLYWYFYKKQESKNYSNKLNQKIKYFNELFKI